MEAMHMIKEKLCKELDAIAKKRELNSGDLDVIYKVTESVKNIYKIDMLEQAEDEYGGGHSRDDGMSRDGYSERRDRYGRYSRDGYSRGSSYEGGNSRRGYSRDGGYSQRRGYSGHSKEEMIESLEEMMENAETEQERDAIKRCVMQMKNT